MTPDEEAKKSWKMANDIWHDLSIPNLEKQERVNGCLIDCLGYILGTRKPHEEAQ